nr:MAG TPA: hypothetical protein [Caudoviricetes sp.]
MRESKRGKLLPLFYGYSSKHFCIEISTFVIGRASR